MNGIRQCVAILLFALPLLFASAAYGLSALPYAAAMIVAPIGLIAIFRARPTIPFAAGIALVASATVGIILAHIASPLRVPLVASLLLPSLGSLGLLGVGQMALQGRRLAGVHLVMAVGLVATLSLAAQASLATGLAPDAYPPAMAGLMTFVVTGLLIWLVSSICGRFEQHRFPFGYAIGIACICALVVFMFASMFFVPHALFARMSVQTYRLNLTFDEKEQRFRAREWMTVDLQWSDDGDVARTKEGHILPWAEQAAIRRESFSESLLRGFDVKGVKFTSIDSDRGREVLQIRLELEAQRSPTTRKVGITSHIAEFQLPSVLGLSPAVVAPAAGNIEIDVQVPEYFGLKHNLDATTQKTVRAGGDLGEFLRAHRVDDLWGMVRLRYPIRLLRNPLFATFAEFDGWALIIAALAAITGLLGYLAAVVFDVFKDQTIKPFAHRLLLRMKLLSNPATELADADIDRSG